jgi:polar amino acid transport system substrate-binding protein
MLLAGRVDVAVCSTLGARAAMTEVDGGRQLDVSPELARFDLHHYLHERRQALAPRIADAIRRLRDSGELEQLTAVYEAQTSSS